MTNREKAAVFTALADADDLDAEPPVRERELDHEHCAVFRHRGWTFRVFVDAGDWDYIDSVESPAGRVWDHNEVMCLGWEPDHAERWGLEGVW